MVAVPVGAPDTVSEMLREVDDVVCILQPAVLHGIGRLLSTSLPLSLFHDVYIADWQIALSLLFTGMWYRDFTQTEDAEVLDLLSKAEQSLGASAEVSEE